MTSHVAIEWPSNNDERYMPIVTAMTEPLGRLTRELHELGVEANVAIVVSCKLTISEAAGTPAAHPAADECAPTYDAAEPVSAI